ncbi:hypothetical protein IVA88_15630 [Bradyrhizobium sp. 149]|uniref:hypothetical protein n=1 Tax=Bradyrhizobium sp. 149 TaxID=2782624 RepID=UPI001FFAE9AB|nr:hypothetical protein [Bradyrhizobium sp. 149]MCK1652854.1 hypothetical protein [Bradyrhizobium sp. 149]
MSEIITSRRDAISFVEFNINEEAMKISLTLNSNGTYTGATEFDDSGPVPDPASASAAKTAAKTAIEAGNDTIEVTLAADGTYAVA